MSKSKEAAEIEMQSYNYLLGKLVMQKQNHKPVRIFQLSCKQYFNPDGSTSWEPILFYGNRYEGVAFSAIISEFLEKNKYLNNET